MSEHIFVNVVALHDAVEAVEKGASVDAKALLRDLRAVLDYLWKDELKHYGENLPESALESWDDEALVAHARERGGV